ncbi:hypothetical protein CY34DRAFT_804796 [Suillus luteus UH-Slu-Lm8-n1]|uniref:Uncharacterized protein n=1 Tax=Suillus luteus UH-Slu-Lm8-n1 TaxID=930992 RepID=A0A0D0BHA8_9AGAM|nr:hypothetical protein CY34DRAFT_804796 [Suillus luteus UH-Slu-Lm8-n1]
MGFANFALSIRTTSQRQYENTTYRPPRHQKSESCQMDHFSGLMIPQPDLVLRLNVPLIKVC